MTMKQGLINQIKERFCLNIYETKAWIALLGKGVASAGEIAEISGVPRSRAYDVLENLEKRGFAIMKIGKPVKYIAVKPNIIIEKLKSNVLKEADDRIEDIIKLKDTDEYNELKELYTVGIQPVKHNEISGLLKSKSLIYNHIKELLENAKKEVVICISAQEINSKSKFFSSLFEILKQKNVNVKLAISGDEKDIKKINSKLKIKTKTIHVDTRFFIVDKQEILFVISNGKHPDEEIAIWLNAPFFASALSFMFDGAVAQG